VLRPKGQRQRRRRDPEFRRPELPVRGVVMHLVAKREGLMLSLGADAIEITMGQ